MSMRTQIHHGLRTLFRRGAADRALTDEVEHYLAELVDAYRARGLSEADAVHAARLDLGSRTAVAQQVRAAGWETGVEALLVDLRRAARRLRRAPGFAAVTVITLALGIGASTAIFSTIRPVLLEPLPYPDSGRVVVLSDTAINGSPLDLTFGTYREIMARSRTLQWGAVSRTWQPTLNGGTEAERLDGQAVSADYFRVLGVAPALGRDFLASDDLPGAAPVVILTDGVWRRHFAADPSAIGRTMLLDGAAVTVVGVMPRTFEHVWKPETRIWRPLGYDPTLPPDGREWGHHLQMFARLAAAPGLEGMRRELVSIAKTPVAAFTRPRWASMDGGLTVTPLQEHVAAPAKPTLRAVMGATFLLLLVAAVNVVTLMLGRGAERRTELATCAAFGASRFRLLTPLLAEGILLAVIGGALGVALAYAMVGALVTLEGVSIPRLEAIRVDRAALAFAAALSAGIGVLAAAIPGLMFSALAGPLASGARVVATGHRLRRAFVAAEVALALVLLVGAGLLLQSVERLVALPMGFRPEHVLTMQIQATGVAFRDPQAVPRFFERVRTAVAAVPGVTTVGVTSLLPLGGDSELYGVQSYAEFRNAPASARAAVLYAVGPNYFDAMGIPLVSGRWIDERDRADAPPVVVLSAALARRHFADRSPLGETIRIGSRDVWYTVVGVAGNVRQSSPAISPIEAAYVADAQRVAGRAMWIVVRAASDPAALQPAIRRAIQGIDRDQPILRVATMEQRVAASAARQRFAMTAFQTFAAVALLLAVVGIYGVLAGTVVDRTREIALRSAIGASRARIMGLILRQAAAVAIVGVLTGAAIAGLTSRGLASLLFEVSPLDGVTYAGVAVLLLIAAGLGAIVPAWRAARIAPRTALQA
jgi:putative ABC transport system permease protein